MNAVAISPTVPLAVFPTRPKASRFSNLIATSFTSAGWPIPAKEGPVNSLRSASFCSRASAGIDIISNETMLDRFAYNLESELARNPILNAIQLHITVLSVVNFGNREEFA
jgi:hypothetical protein